MPPRSVKTTDYCVLYTATDSKNMMCTSLHYDLKVQSMEYPVPTQGTKLRTRTRKSHLKSRPLEEAEGNAFEVIIPWVSPAKTP